MHRPLPHASIRSIEREGLGILWAELPRTTAEHQSTIAAGAMVNGNGAANPLKMLGSGKPVTRRPEACAQQSAMKRSGGLMR
jgi:hypothetical protein